jgi:hypothetical protein
VLHTLLTQLALAGLAVAATVMVHLGGLVLLIALLRRLRGGRFGDRLGPAQAGLVLLAVFSLFALHAVEIWAYAFLYLLIGAVKSFEPALYYSTVTYTTIGYGDVILPERWRILGAIEGANGIILMGWSTAFLVSVVQRLRALEHDAGP